MKSKIKIKIKQILKTYFFTKTGKQKITTNLTKGVKKIL